MTQLARMQTVDACLQGPLLDDLRDAGVGHRGTLAELDSIEVHHIVQAPGSDVTVERNPGLASERARAQTVSLTEHDGDAQVEINV